MSSNNAATPSNIPPLDYNPPQGPLRILHRDEDLLILSKPAGLLSVPGRHADHQDCLELRARAEFPQALLTHRLDRGTSGVFVMAMNRRAQGLLGKHFQRRLIEKTYVALVEGCPADPAGQIDLPLRCDWPNRPMQMVCHEQGKPALTRWELIAQEGERARLRLYPETGRSHQLRVHLREIGHPIIGDELYGQPAERMMLHAESLSLHHPADGRLVSFTDACPF